MPHLGFTLLLAVLLSAALALLALNGRSAPQDLQSDWNQNIPQVTAPPESFFARIPDRDRDTARQFYKKYLEIKGVPLVAAAEVARPTWIQFQSVPLPV